MISCLMVTQASRFTLAQGAIGDFVTQTHSPRELVIVHDSGASFDALLRAHCSGLGGAPIRVLDAAPGLRLGELRNVSMAAAAGRWVCQWDDDDRYHPLRLSLQFEALQRAGATACFLVDQLHWFVPSQRLFWTDWVEESYPMNFVQGTLMGERALLPPYPALARGEDTGFTQALLQSGAPIARLRHQGWCTTYVFHGDNVWDEAHHAAIARAHGKSAAMMQNQAALLKARLAEYVPPFMAG